MPKESRKTCKIISTGDLNDFERYYGYDDIFIEELYYVTFFVPEVGYDEENVFDIFSLILELMKSTNLNSDVSKIMGKTDVFEKIKKAVSYVDGFIRDNYDFLEKIIADSLIIQEQEKLNKIRTEECELDKMKYDKYNALFKLFLVILFLYFFVFLEIGIHTLWLFILIGVLAAYGLSYLIEKRKIKLSEQLINCLQETKTQKLISEEQKFLLIFHRSNFKLKFEKSIKEIIYEKNKIIQEKINRERIENIKKMNPYDFEKFMAELFDTFGFKTKITKKSGDDGIDIFLWKGEEKIAVQCKRQKGNVGTPSIRNFIGSMQFANVKKGFFVTTGRFSLETIKMLKSLNYELILIDIGIIEQLIKAKNEGVDMNQFDNILAEGMKAIISYTRENLISRQKGQEKYKYLEKKRHWKKHGTKF